MFDCFCTQEGLRLVACLIFTAFLHKKVFHLRVYAPTFKTNLENTLWIMVIGKMGSIAVIF